MTTKKTPKKTTPKSFAAAAGRTNETMMADMLADIMAAETSVLTVDDMCMSAQLLGVIAELEPPEKGDMTTDEYRAAMKKHQRFTYAVGRNLDKASRIFKRAQRHIKPTAGYLEYNSARVELCKHYATIGGDKKPITEADGSFVIDPADRCDFDLDVESLRADHVDAIEQRTVQVEVYNEMLEQPVDVNLYMVTEDMLPDTLTARQVAVCAMFIKESE